MDFLKYYNLSHLQSVSKCLKPSVLLHCLMLHLGFDVSLCNYLNGLQELMHHVLKHLWMFRVLHLHFCWKMPNAFLPNDLKRYMNCRMCVRR